MSKLKSFFSITFLSIASIVAVSLGACEDDHEHSDNVQITLTTPAEDQEFNQGDTVLISGSVTGEEELHGYEVFIRNRATSDTVFHEYNHAHATTLTISHQWVVNVSDHSDMEAVVVATIDHDNNTKTGKVNFHCMP